MADRLDVAVVDTLAVRPASASSRPKPARRSGACSALRNDSFIARQRHPILRPLRSGQARLDRAQIERQDLGELRLGAVVGAEELLFLGIALDQIDFGVGAAGAAQIVRASR